VSAQAVPTEPAPKLWNHLSIALFVGVLALLLLTLRDYGPSWDEDVQARYGDMILRWYASGFKDQAALTYRDLFLYGGLFEVIAQAAAHVLPFSLYTSRHLVNALFGLLGAWAVFRLGRRIDGPRGGFLAALFLLATPRYYGHLAVNPKDVPFAAMAALYLDAAVASLDRSRPWLRTSLWLGLTLGGALAVRVPGLLLPSGLLLALLLDEGSLVARVTRVGRFVALPLLVAWPVMMAFWPWAAGAPWSRPFLALTSLTRGGTGWLVLFDGRWVETASPPVRFVPVWFLHTLPEFQLLSLAALAFLTVLAVRRTSRARVLPLLLLGVAAALPPLAALVMRSRQYDGARHFLFCLPPLSVLAAVGASRLLSRGRVGKTCFAAVLACVLLSVVEMVRLHPYEYVYFNRALTGGLPGAASRFQLDYWGLSYKEGTEWLLQNYHKGERPRTRPIEVANCSIDFLTESVLESSPRHTEFQEVRKKDDSHVFLSLRNEECDVPLSGPLLHVVEREGVPLLEIRELRRPS
jgi:hypothetical protein